MEPVEDETAYRNNTRVFLLGIAVAALVPFIWIIVGIFLAYLKN